MSANETSRAPINGAALVQTWDGFTDEQRMQCVTIASVMEPVAFPIHPSQRNVMADVLASMGLAHAIRYTAWMASAEPWDGTAENIQRIINHGNPRTMRIAMVHARRLLAWLNEPDDDEPIEPL